MVDSNVLNMQIEIFCSSQADVLVTLQTTKDRILLPYAVKIQRWWLRKQEHILEHLLTRTMQTITTSFDKATIHGVQVYYKLCNFTIYNEIWTHIYFQYTSIIVDFVDICFLGANLLSIFTFFKIT